MPAGQAAAFDFERLTVAGVSRRYGRRRALAGVSATLRAGELVGLLGPNGAGKSTLLGLLATLIQPSGGTVLYGGRPAADLGAALRARLGFLSHELQLYGDLTARENLEFFGGLYGLRGAPRRAAAALERAGLADRADDPVQGSPAACGSGWRWSGRCCTIRGWCCSTSRSPAWTKRPAAPWPNGCGRWAATGASCCWRRTIWKRWTDCSTASCCSAPAA